MLRKILFFILIWIILSVFYVINDKNYKMHRFFLIEKVNHPEFIPSTNLAKFSSFWFKETKADLYWLETIQYIWSNAVSAQYKKYLYKMLNLITDLSPYFEHPYVIWELLLPDYNPRYEKWTENEKNIDLNISQAEKIWLKWIKQFCDKSKIKLIENEYNLQKIKTQKKYRNPCKSYRIPFNLAYIYFFYKHDWKEASKYYRITYAIDNSPAWAWILAAIMQWKSWDRIKSVWMFINMIDKNWLKKEELKIVDSFSKMINWILFWKIPLNKENLKILNDTLKTAFPKKEEKDKQAFKDNDWENYIKKAVRELNLFYIENANKKYKKDFWKDAKDARELYDKGYLDYFPIDFQQYEDYWVAYVFNEETKHFDSSQMKQYNEHYFEWFMKK
jgi:hypothetical protein